MRRNQGRVRLPRSCVGEPSDWWVLVEVTNASYGFQKDDHSYTVGVEKRGGLAVPAECACPADKYNEEYDCKHKMALATVGGPTVLNAAIDFDDSAPRSSRSDTETAADKLRAEGGDDECDCSDWDDDLPCADCYISGKREFPE